ncbi:MAG: hypothetical protein ACI8W8_001384 [Rhodothermales bacterium]|jgi:hypothetical protein
MKKLLVGLMAASITCLSFAETQPINLSLTPDISLQDRSDRIEGLTLSIWGENEQESLAIGFVNGSVGESMGLSLGLLNYADNYTGLQWGVLNTAKQDYAGWQHGFGNHVGGELYGLQTGWLNCANHLRGVQLGLVNFTQTAGPGLQVGLLNIIAQNDMWFVDLPEQVAPAMIFVNWRF